MVKLNHAVKEVVFLEEINKFEVTVRNRDTDNDLPKQLFDYVVNATGHYSSPNSPDDFPGIESFKVMLRPGTGQAKVQIFL